MKLKILICVLTLFVSFNSLYPKTDSVKTSATPLVAYKSPSDSLWHILDETGKEMMKPAQLTEVMAYSEGFFLVTVKYKGKQRYAFMNMEGNIAVMNCDYAKPFVEGMAVTVDEVDSASGLSYFGFINEEGLQVIPQKYLDVTDFNDGYAWVMNKDERGWIDKRGRMVMQIEGNKFGSQFHEGLAAIQNENYLFGYVNMEGKLVIDYQFDEAKYFTNGLAPVIKNGFYGFIDTAGKMVIRAEYDYYMDFDENYTFAGKTAPNHEPIWGIINNQGKHITDFIYTDARNFSQGIGLVRQDGKWKFVDYFGNKIIDTEYDGAEQFKDNLAWVSLDEKNKQGYINPLGEFVVNLPKAEHYVDLRWNKKLK